MTNRVTDIVVIGSGIAGYAAALAAAETRNVILIDKQLTPGGATTHSNVGTLCGLYYQASEAELISHRFCESFVHDLFKHDKNAQLVSLPNNLHAISYEWSALQAMLLDHLTASKNIQLLWGTEVVHANTNEAEIESLTLKNTEGKTTIFCKNVIDCSGTGCVAQLLAHPMIQDNAYQSAAQIIRLSNVADTNEYALNLALKRSLIKNSAYHVWPKSYTRISIVPGSLRNNSVDLKIPLATTITDSQQHVQELQQEVNQHLESLLHAFHQTESLKDAKIETIFPVPGIRTQQRPLGQYVLSSDDVLNNIKPTDGIALGTWPVETWDYDGNISLTFSESNNGYTIPARCLASPVYKNLFFAGKGISAEAKAIASARVTGTCLQTGYAAGKLAACTTNTERLSFIAELQAQFSKL